MTVMDGARHFTIAPYMWLMGVRGDVSVANLPHIPIEATFSDMISDVDVGVQGHFEGRRNRVDFGVDVFHVGFGVPVEADAPVIGDLALDGDMRYLVARAIRYIALQPGAAATTPERSAPCRTADARESSVLTEGEPLDPRARHPDLTC